VPKLDLDRWLAALQQPASAAAPSAPAASAPRAPAPSAPATASQSFLGDLTAKVAFEVGEVIYNKQPVRNVVLEIDAKGGAVAVPKLSATLPGDMVLQAQSTLTGDAARPGVTGQFSLVGPKLRETLSWLAVDLSSVPPSKLQKLSLRGRMSSTGGNVQVSDAVFELDDLKGSGGVTVTFAVPLSIVTSVSLDTLDLDSFLVPGRGAAEACRCLRCLGAAFGACRCRPLGRAQGQGGQAHLQQGDDPGCRCRCGAAGHHAPAERRQGFEPGRRPSRRCAAPSPTTRRC
jgi:hypothetical protein